MIENGTLGILGYRENMPTAMHRVLKGWLAEVGLPTGGAPTAASAAGAAASAGAP